MKRGNLLKKKFFSSFSFQPKFPQIDDMSGNSREEKFTIENRRNMALLREFNERKRRQLDKSAQRR